MRAKRLLVAAALAALLVIAGLWAPAQTHTAVQAANPPETQRQGAWLDSIVLTEQNDAEQAVADLQANELDLYAYTVNNAALWQTVLEDPDLGHSEAFGSYNELTFNPAGPEFYDGRLNPFSNAAVREAMNWLVDRDYLVQSILGGLGMPKFTSLNSAFPDADRYRNTLEAIEAEYAYDLAQAQAAISAEMLAMGAYLQGGTWHYDGAPVRIIFIIRVEDERRAYGDYVSDQLEEVGFTVDRQYKTRSQASPIWNQSDPWEGLWHLYTGGWITTAISRDDATNFGYFYTPLGSGSPLWQNYQPTDAFMDVAEPLWTNDFSSMAERDALFEQALGMAMDDAGAAPPEGAGSLRAWLVDALSFAPQRADVVVAADLAGGVAGAQMFPYVARFEGVEGGEMRIAQPGVLIEPWNPVAGSNWIYDLFPQEATADYDFLADPNTGLYWPQRVESAECVVKEGLPVEKTLDWISLTTAPVVEVPEDAWADWDATSKTFIAAGDMPTPTLETNTKCTITYPEDLFNTVTWHDGSPLDVSDFVLRMILTFDRAKPDSPIYDESAVPSYDALMSHFRGVVIESTDPLVITTYDDIVYLDAEWIARSASWWPAYYGFYYQAGQGAWHDLAAAIRAEAHGELAFSSDKSGNVGVPWTNFLAGESLGIMESWMNTSAGDGYIPYSPTMGAYVTQAEADARWANLQAWYATRGHFWLGTGPFYLASADWDAKTLRLEHFGSFADPAGKWDAFADTQPEASINHDSGAPGSYFNITGSGFPPDSTAIVTINDTVVGQTPVDSAGAVAFTLATGQADPGEYHVRVSVNPTAGVAFTLDEAAPIQPREGELPLIEVPDGLITHRLYLPLAMRAYDPKLLFFDDFSDPSSGWPISESGDYQYRYVSGEYEVYCNRANAGPDILAPMQPATGEHSVEVDMHRVSGVWQFGIMFDLQGYRGYYFDLEPDVVEGGYTLWKYDNGWEVLVSGTSSAINPGDATNHIKAERRGSLISLYANDQLLTSVVDDTFTEGYAGVTMFPSTRIPAVVRFDNFKVRGLGGAKAGGDLPSAQGMAPWMRESSPDPEHR